MLGSLSCNDIKAVRELKEILSNNINARNKAENDKVVSMHSLQYHHIIIIIFTYNYAFLKLFCKGLSRKDGSTGRNVEQKGKVFTSVSNILYAHA